MITYVKGDLLEAFDKGEIDVILHQTNCISKEDISGIAKSIFSKYPEALKVHLEEGLFGGFSEVLIEDKMIINCNSQYYPGACSDNLFKFQAMLNDCCTTYEMPDNFNNRLSALKSVLNSMLWELPYNTRIGIPLIGSGLGADLVKKGNMTDLEYFKYYIAPEIENLLKDLIVYENISRII